VADSFAGDGYRVVLTGTPDEAGIAADVAGRMRYGALNLAGRTSLGAMAALLSEASLLVSNDTGVSHLAAALHVPSVIVFIASDPDRWSPLDRRLHRVVGREGSLPEEIGPDAVLREAHQLLIRRQEKAKVTVVTRPQSIASADGILSPEAAVSPEVTHA
jgi:ADP-heptose:LPS heptosyltransferase